MATGLVRHITVFSEILCACLEYVQTLFSPFCQWEWVKCIIELIVCTSLSQDENNNTIRPIRTASLFWNWHFSWYICCYFSEGSEAHINETSVSNTNACFCMWYPSSRSMFSCWSCFSHTIILLCGFDPHHRVVIVELNTTMDLPLTEIETQTLKFWGTRVVFP